MGKIIIGHGIFFPYFFAALNNLNFDLLMLSLQSFIISLVIIEILFRFSFKTYFIVL